MKECNNDDTECPPGEKCGFWVMGTTDRKCIREDLCSTDGRYDGEAFTLLCPNGIMYSIAIEMVKESVDTLFEFYDVPFDNNAIF